MSDEDHPYYRHKIDFFADHCVTGRVLDFGCGGGHYSLSLASRGYDIWGVDSNVERLKEATEKADDAGLGDRCQFVEVSTLEHRLPFDDRHFDSVFASEIIEHVPDVSTFISEIKRVLRKDGSLFLTTPNGVSYRHITKNLIWRAEKRIPEIESWPQFLPGKEGHIYYWDLWTLYRLVNINGFGYVAHDYAESHDIFRRVSALVPVIKPLRTGLLLALKHIDTEMLYR